MTNVASRTYLAMRTSAEAFNVEIRTLAEFATLDDLLAWNPTGALIFMYGWPEAAADAVSMLKTLGIKVGVWQVDDPQYLSSRELRDVTIRIAESATIYFSHTRELDEQYAKLGVRVVYLPTGARLLPGEEPLLQRPLPDSDYELDVSFVGTLNEARLGFLDALARELAGKHHVTCFEGISAEEALRVYRTSRISLSLGAGCQHGTTPALGLTERTWEVPLVGGFLLQPDLPYLGEHFAVGETATFGDPGTCARQLLRYLRDPTERLALATRAQAHVQREHTIGHRVHFAATLFKRDPTRN